MVKKGKEKRDRSRDRQSLRTAPEGTAARGSVSLVLSNPRVNQLLPALRLARGFLGHPGAHLLVAWGLLPQSTRAPPCGATAPAGRTDLRPGEDILTNGSGPTHLLATVDIDQRSSLPSSHRTLHLLASISANSLLGKRALHSLIGMS